MNTIRRKRREGEITQRDLANALGCTQQLVSYWEHGARNPSPETRRELARLLGISEAALFCEDRRP